MSEVVSFFVNSRWLLVSVVSLPNPSLSGVLDLSGVPGGVFNVSSGMST